MNAPPLRIGLLGYFGYGNFGNDASLEAMTSFLNRVRPDAELTCICVAPDGVDPDRYKAVVAMVPPKRTGLWSRLSNAVLLKLPRFVEVARHAVRHVRTLDVIIVPGTGLLQDYWAKPWQLPATLYTWCLAARLCGKKLGFVSVGAGPSRNWLSGWLLKSSAGLAQFRSYRDEESRNYMVGLGVGSKNDPVSSDIVFARYEPATERQPEIDPRPVVIGVGLVTHFGWWGNDQAVYETYVRKISQFIVRILDDGCHVRIFIGDLSDQPAVDDVMRSVGKEKPEAVGKLVIAERAYSQRDLVRQMSLVHAVVAMRFHNVICAIKLGKPVINIGFSQKADRMLADMGISEFSQRLEQLDVDVLYQQLQKLLGDRMGQTEKMRRALSQFQARLENQEAIVSRELLGQPVA
jgi:polysaccharide pyruvyl transferase WcaK-like protein